MDWFHCNQCFSHEGSDFFVSSCGHIFCKQCAGTDKCPTCEQNCKYLLLNDNIKPEEKMFFKNPVETALNYIAHISQVWTFQKGQMELLASFYRRGAQKVEGALEQAREKLTTQQKELEALLNENQELKTHLRQLKDSQRQQQHHLCSSRNGTPRPVGITSPLQTVTPQPSLQHSSEVNSRLTHFPSMDSVSFRSSQPLNWQYAPGATPMTQGRMTPADSTNAIPSPASSQGLFYRASSSSSHASRFTLQRPIVRPSQSATSQVGQQVETPNFNFSIFTDQTQDTAAFRDCSPSRLPSPSNNGKVTLLFVTIPKSTSVI